MRRSDWFGAAVQGLCRRAVAHHHRPVGRAVPQPRRGLRATLPLPVNVWKLKQLSK